MRANIDDGHGEQAFYAIESNDYLGVVAVTPQGLYPLVHQLRPVAGFVTCELPAGTVETGETPEAAARREMLEETGLRVRKLTKLGTHCSDSGRLTNRIHSFFAETDSPDPNFKPEPGLTVEYVSKSELIRRVKLGEIHQLLHVGAVLLALLD
ncbi:MAG: NUDIX hydrolase [Deltaproteobacteria bacterium]|nr:NUDIX hydrolase [Deltaproteobacteria bacterium]MBI3296397.1 NUDIX hydrolase [Deltaproteobacteria bacterium]